MLRSLLGRMVIASGALLVLTPPSALTRPVDDLLFTRHDGLSGAGSTLVRWIEDARLHGLDLELAPDVRAWIAGADGDFTRQREVERALDGALVRLVAELPPAPREVPVIVDADSPFYAGPDALWRGLGPRTASPESLEAARLAALSGSLDAFLQALLPRHPQYARLVSAARRYAALCAAGGWEPVAAPKVGKRAGWTPPPAVAVAFQTRLMREGLYPPPGEVASGIWDEATARALDAFRANRQVPNKALDDRDLIAALAVGCEERLATLLLNVKRWRVSAWRGESTFVEVNIAAQELRYVRDGVDAARERTIVGSTRWYFDEDLQRRLNVRATPILRDQISRIVVNPTWTVPTRIAKNEIDHEVAKDPTYLERKNIEVVEIGGRSVYQQRPGEDNALGLIKILFPNKESVYLHDTPKKGAFRLAVRALSHGCVRVENAVDLGITLLSHDAARQGEAFDESGVRGRLGAAGPLIYNLTTPIPIFLEYYTASVGDDGAVRFHPDIYAYDAAVFAAR